MDYIFVFSCLFRLTSLTNLCILCRNLPVTGNSSYKEAVMQKLFPYNAITMVLMYPPKWYTKRTLRGRLSACSVSCNVSNCWCEVRRCHAANGFYALEKRAGVLLHWWKRTIVGRKYLDILYLQVMEIPWSVFWLVHLQVKVFWNNGLPSSLVVISFIRICHGVLNGTDTLRKLPFVPMTQPCSIWSKSIT